MHIKLSKLLYKKYYKPMSMLKKLKQKKISLLNLILSFILKLNNKKIIEKFC